MSAMSNNPVSKSVASTGAGAATASQSRSGVVIEDISIDVPHGPDVPAYVVRPAGQLAAHSQAGVLFLHWLGQIHNDRTEYLGEAVTLASQGVVSLLPQGAFPWTESPVGHSQDVETVLHQAAAFKVALHRLAAIPAVDETRIGLVGHDYGAMYGALVADQDPQVSALVLETPTRAGATGSPSTGSTCTAPSGLANYRLLPCDRPGPPYRTTG